MQKDHKLGERFDSEVLSKLWIKLNYPDPYSWCYNRWD